MRRLIPFALALGLLAGCTQSQSMVSAELTYTAAARAAASYVLRPDADPVRVAAIRRLDANAYAALVAARASADAGLSGGTTGVIAASAALSRYAAEQGAP